MPLLVFILARENINDGQFKNTLIWVTTFFGIWVGRLYADWRAEYETESVTERKKTSIRDSLVAEMRSISFAWRSAVHSITILEKKGKYDEAFIRALQHIYGNQRLDFERLVHEKSDEIAKLGGNAKEFTDEILTEFSKHREVAIDAAEKLPHDDGHLSELSPVFKFIGRDQQTPAIEAKSGSENQDLQNLEDHPVPQHATQSAQPVAPGDAPQASRP